MPLQVEALSIINKEQFLILYKAELTVLIMRAAIL
jgi:hypothetical protein